MENNSEIKYPKHLLIWTQVVDKNHPNLGFFHEWIRELSTKCERITVVALQVGTYDLPQHVQIHSLGKDQGKGKVFMLHRFYKYFIVYGIFDRADAVLYHMGAIYNILGAPFYMMRWFLGATFYWWKTHGHINWAGRLALCFVNHVLTASPESFPIETKKRVVVGHAIAVPEKLHNKKADRKSLHLIAAGRITKSKCQDEAIDVLNTIREKGMHADLTLVGDIVDEAYYSRIMERVQTLTLDGAVSYKGAVSNAKLTAMYRDHHILLHLSKTGSVDKVVLEAMVHGVIPIAREGAYPFLTPYGLTIQNARESVSIIERLLKLSPDEYASLQDSLYNYVAENHSLTTLPERIFMVR